MGMGTDETDRLRRDMLLACAVFIAFTAIALGLGGVLNALVQPVTAPLQGERPSS